MGVSKKVVVPHVRKDTAPNQFNWFAAFAHFISYQAGKPIAFVIALVVILLWAASGPFFDFSNTWQLVINTTTTIITFLMVFVIQTTQNRDQLALQAKLADLIVRQPGSNKLAIAEDLSDEELETLHEHFQKAAQKRARAKTKKRKTVSKKSRR